MEPDYIKQKALIRILDDDEALGAALKLYLELDGWQVAAYTSARRFFAEDRPSVPGCLVLDVRMPELTGLECQRLLNERQSNIPIVFISGHGDIDMAVRTILDGAYDFLQKPVDEETAPEPFCLHQSGISHRRVWQKSTASSCQYRPFPCRDQRNCGRRSRHG